MSAQRTAILLLLFGSLVCTGLAPSYGQQNSSDEDSLKNEVTRIQPLDPDEALKSFELPDGFHLELVVAEPMVTDPIAMEFDENGRMYVVEMRGYPFARPEGDPPLGRIRLLQDTDGDGKADRSTIFADGLSWPTGVLPYKGGVFVAVAPDLLYLKDTDGDNVADLRRVVFTGFGTQNVQSLPNNLRWGLDHWVYGAGGPNGGDIRPGDRPEAEPVSIRRQDFRFDPVTETFEANTGGGQFGHTLDDWGNRFVCNNSNHIRHLVLPGRYLARNPFLSAPSVILDISPEGGSAPVYRLSQIEPWRKVRTRFREAEERRYAIASVRHDVFTAATGITVYRSSAYPEQYYGNVFLGDVQGNFVHRKKLVADGLTFVAHRTEQNTEFLRSTDNWFRPANLANGPDGCLYILDMYRETIEHPESIPDNIKQHLDLTSGYDRGRIYRLVPEGFRRPAPPRLGNATTPELVAALKHRDGWWRDTAHRLLFERQDRTAVGPLRKLARDADFPQTRLHALWSLEGLGALDDASLERALGDPVSGVREHAVRLAEGRLNRSARLRDKVLALADDPQPRVRAQTAFALYGLKDDKAGLGALTKIAQHDAGDRWIRTAVLTSVSTRAGRLFGALLSDPRFLKQREAAVLLESLAALVGARNDPSEVAALLQNLVGPAFANRPSLRRSLVLGLGDGLERGGGALRDVLSRSDSQVANAAEALSVLFRDAASVVADEEQDAGSRIEAVRLLGYGRFDDSAPALVELLNAREPKEVQLAAVQALSRLPGTKVGELLVERWRSYSPPVRREVVEALFRRTERLPALLDAIQSRLATPGDLDLERRRMLLEHSDTAIRARAKKLLGGELPSDRKGIIERFRPSLALIPDAARGAKVFEKYCSTCHRVGDVGKEVGPDLATVQNQTPESLLEKILDPNREVQPNYLNYILVTAEGKIITGIVAEETATSVRIRRAEGAEDTVLRSNIEELVSTGVSLMPEGLEKEIDEQQMADLIGFVLSINKRAAGQVGGGR